MFVLKNFADEYLLLVLKGLNVIKQDLKDKITKCHAQRSSQEHYDADSLCRSEASLRLVSGKIAELTSDPAIFLQSVQETLDALETMYQRIRIRGSELLAKTRWVRIPYVRHGSMDGEKEAGTFLVVVNALQPYFRATEYFTIKILRPNEDKEQLSAMGIDPYSYIHPHVSIPSQSSTQSEGGIPCWVGYKPILEPYLILCDFLGLLIPSYIFLSSVNDNFASTYSSEKFLAWPEVKNIPVSREGDEATNELRQSEDQEAASNDSS